MEIFKNLETNGNENMTTENIWELAKAVLHAHIHEVPHAYMKTKSQIYPQAKISSWHRLSHNRAMPQTSVPSPSRLEAPPDVYLR